MTNPLCPEPTSEQKLQILAKLMNFIPDFYFVTDRDLLIRYANQAMSDYYNTPKDKMVGKYLHEVEENKDLLAYFEQKTHEIIHEGKPSVVNDPVDIERNGKEMHMRSHIVPFINPQNNEPMIIGLARDVTAEIKYQNEKAKRMVFEHEMELAREIQSSSNPKVCPDLTGLDMEGFMQPAVYAGGDFYDWWQKEDGTLEVVIGDVAGHGVGPALLAAECRAYARILLDQLPMKEAIDKLDRHISNKEKIRFITFAAANYNPVTHEMQYLSAGHGPLLFYKAKTNQVEELETHRIPLGTGITMSLVNESRFTIEPGDVFMLSSDGFLEAQNSAKEFYGKARLKEAFHRITDVPKDKMIPSFLKHIQEFTTEIHDDQTVIFIRKTGN